MPTLWRRPFAAEIWPVGNRRGTRAPRTGESADAHHLGGVRQRVQLGGDGDRGSHEADHRDALPDEGAPEGRCGQWPGVRQAS